MQRIKLNVFKSWFDKNLTGRKRNEQRKSTIVCSQRDPISWKAMILNDEVSANSIMKRTAAGERKMHYPY